MIYTIDPTVDEPIMLINKHIGFDEADGMGIDGSAFMLELLQLDTLGKKRIQIWINSPGGIVTDGYSIYSAILKSKTPVDTYCVGAAASIAGVIFQAGRKRIMADYSWLMYHNPFGSSNDAVIKTMRESIITMIEQRCGMTEKQVGDMMNRTTFIAADEALTMKLCDEVDASTSMNTKYLRKVTDAMSFHKECNKVVNTLINNQNKNSNTMLTKVAMRLKLNEAATAGNIIEEIDALENRAKKAEEDKLDAENKAKDKAKADGDEKDKLKAKLKDAQDAFEKAKADFEDCKQKLDAMETDKLAAENASKEIEAKNMVEGFAKAGRIKNEATVILQWTKLAKADFDGTKNMMESLPMNVTAVKIIDAVANKLDKGQLPTTAMGLAVKNKLKREGKI